MKKRKSDLSYPQERLLYLIPNGHQNAIHIADLQSMTGFNSQEIKNVVQKKKKKGYPICSGRDGYWLTNSSLELKSTINLLRAHKDTLENTVDALNHTLKELD